MDMYNDLLTTIANSAKDTNKEILDNCVRVYQLNNIILEKHNGDDHSSGYKKEMSIVYRTIRYSKSSYIRDSQIGGYLSNNPDNDDLWELTKSKIYNQYIRQPKPKTTKPKVKPESNEEFYKDILVQIKSRMDSVGGWSVFCKKMGFKEDALGI